MESGPSRVNAPLEGPVIPRSRRDLFKGVNAPLEGPVIPRSRRDLFKDQSFGESDNADRHQGIHDRMGMQRMRREGVESAPGLVPWRGKGRSGTGVGAWCRSEFVEVEYRQPSSFGSRRA